MELMRFDPWLRTGKPDFWRRFFPGDWLEPWSGESENFLSERFVPPVDIRETDDSYILEVELPGIKKEDVHIDVKEGDLNLAGERKYEHEEEKDNYTRLERCYGTFNRRFTLPDHVDIDKIDASYKNGVLLVTLPKGEKAKPKTIDVKIQ